MSLTEQPRIQLELAQDEAIVLFELLADFPQGDENSLRVPSTAERLALMRLSGALERVLVEPFRSDYPEILAAAKQSLIQQMGEGEDQ